MLGVISGLLLIVSLGLLIVMKKNIWSLYLNIYFNILLKYKMSILPSIFNKSLNKPRKIGGLYSIDIGQSKDPFNRRY